MNLVRILAILVPLSMTASAQTVNPFGLMLPAAQRHLDEAFQFVGQMNVTFYRALAVVLDRPLACPECQAAHDAGLQLVLSLRASGSGAQQPSAPPRDLALYRRRVQAAIRQFQPALVVIENEPNSSTFYTGTAAEYLVELKTGCEAAHVLNVKCTDGGVVSKAVAALAVQHYIDRGERAQALSLAQRSLGVPLKTFFDLEQQLAQHREQVQRAQQIVLGLKLAGVDYVNFHWYESDTTALREVIAYLRGVAGGAPVISNEIGQRNDDPDETVSKLKTVLAEKLPIAIWFSGDALVSRALQNPDFSLRATGEAFQQFTTETFVNKLAPK